MNVASIKNKAYRLTNTNSSTFLDGDATNILEELNTQYGHRILDVLHARVDINANIKEAYTDIIAVTGLSIGNQGYEGEYPFPTDLLRPTRVELKYDGTNWHKAEVYDINDNNNTEVQQTVLNSDFSTTHPYVRFERDSYFIRPLPTTSVTGGIRIWYEKRQSDLSTGSPTFEQNLHDILAYDLALQEYLMHRENYDPQWKNAFDVERAKIEDRFREHYKNRFKRNQKLNYVMNRYN